MVKCAIIFGPPCSGKSAAGKYVAKKLKWDYISSGDIARQMAMADPVCHARLNEGIMAPENDMRAHIKNMIVMSFNNHHNFILDGFPRFQEQYDWLMDILNGLAPYDLDPQIIKVLMDVSPYKITFRAVKRGRDDDKSIGTRMAYYYKNTQSMLMEMSDLFIINTDSLTIEEEENKLYNYLKGNDINVTSHLKIR